MRFQVFFQRRTCDVFHHQERCAFFIDAHVVELHDGGVGKLADQSRFAQELFLEVLAKTVNESLQGHGAANDVVPRPFHMARGPRPDAFQGFVTAFVECDHQAERRRRPARSRNPFPWPLPLDCAAGPGIGVCRASGKSSCARVSAFE